MKPQQLLLRCYVEREKRGDWFAICLDLNLVAQGDSMQEAKDKLHSRISSYVREALTVDAQYADHLLPRPAPMSFFLRFYWLRLQSRLRLVGQMKSASVEEKRAFMEPLPLVPA